MISLLIQTDMVRSCSHCGHNGHNSRACHDSSNNKGAQVKLFGVDLITNQNNNSSSNSSNVNIDSSSVVSDGISRPKHESKGLPWTQEEHRAFLAGLLQLGKGEWRRISREFVTTRSSTQVASHAQKYFMRIQNVNMKKKNNKNRSSIFDTPLRSNNNAALTNNTQTDCTGTASKDKELTAKDVNELIPNLGFGYSSSVNPGFPNQGRNPYMGGVIGGMGPAGYAVMMNYGRLSYPHTLSFHNNDYVPLHVTMPFNPLQSLSMVSQEGAGSGHRTSTVVAKEDVNVELKLGPSSDCSTSKPIWSH